MGFVSPKNNELFAQSNVMLDKRGNVEANEENFKTNLKKVFSAGDMRRGQSLVVWAINEGRAAAREIDIYLMGETTLL